MEALPPIDPEEVRRKKLNAERKAEVSTKLATVQQQLSDAINSQNEEQMVELEKKKIALTEIMEGLEAESFSIQQLEDLSNQLIQIEEQAEIIEENQGEEPQPEGK